MNFAVASTDRRRHERSRSAAQSPASFATLESNSSLAGDPSCSAGSSPDASKFWANTPTTPADAACSAPPSVASALSPCRGPTRCVRIHDIVRQQERRARAISRSCDSGFRLDGISLGRRPPHGAQLSRAAAGADIVLASDLPSAAGMSSSSALVVAIFAVLSAVNHLTERSEYTANIHERRGPRRISRLHRERSDLQVARR